MHDDGSLDFDAYRRLIDWHVAEGTNAIVAVGTTGESPTVTLEEHGELIKVAVEAARGRIPVIAGTGGNSTAEAIELTRHAKQVGARRDAAGRAVLQQADAGRLVPALPQDRRNGRSAGHPLQRAGRTVADISNETMLRLAQVPGIVGLKDATGDMARGADLLKRLPADFAAVQRQRRHCAGADAAWRPRRDLGHGQRRAAPDVRAVCRSAGRRSEACAPDQCAVAAVAFQAVR